LDTSEIRYKIAWIILKCDAGEAHLTDLLTKEKTESILVVTLLEGLNALCRYKRVLSKMKEEILR
jgi:hypothetical protein